MVWGGGLTGRLRAASEGLAGGCGVHWWARHANVSVWCLLMCVGECQCTHGSHCVALGHNLVGLWFLSLHWGFLLCIEGYAGGGGGILHIGGLCMVVCIAVFFGVSYDCSFWLFMGPPSTLNYVLSYLFSFIWLGF